MTGSQTDLPLTKEKQEIEKGKKKDRKKAG